MHNTVHKKDQTLLLRASCVMVMLVYLNSSTAKGNDDCGRPGFKWVGSNGGKGAQQGNEGVRAWMVPAYGNGVWVADNFYLRPDVSLDWDPTAEVLLRDPAGSWDISVSQVDVRGNLEDHLIVYGQEWETIDCIQDTGDFVVYCGDFSPEFGNTYSLDFNPFEGVDTHTASTRRWTGDAFVTALSRVENGDLFYEWTVTFGGFENDVADILAADESGIWVAGHFSGTTDLDPGPGEELHTSRGFEDVFLLKLSWAGELLWARSFGGVSGDRPYGLGVDNQGNGYLLGIFNEAVDFNPGDGEDVFIADHNDVFVSKYSTDGAYHWTRVLEPNLDPVGFSLTVGRDGRLLIHGFFEETMDVDPGPGEHWLTARGDDDAVNGLLLMLNSDGEYLWSRQIGGPGEAYVNAAAFDIDGRVIAVGSFRDEVDFNDAGPPDVHVSRGGRDAFLSRFTPDGEYEWTMTWGGPGVESSARQVVAHENGDVTVSGLFQGTVDFDPGEGLHELTAVGVRDMYLLRLGCAEECAQLRKHRAKGGDGQVKSKVVADAALGRVTVECTGASGPHRRRADLDDRGRGKVRLKRLAPGDYECAVTKLEAADGATLCEGAFLPRNVTVE